LTIFTADQVTPSLILNLYMSGGATPSVSIDARTFFSSDPGRFVRASFAGVVQKVFAANFNGMPDATLSKDENMVTGASVPKPSRRIPETHYLIDTR
jgi:hypothetical protein